MGKKEKIEVEEIERGILPTLVDTLVGDNTTHKATITDEHGNKKTGTGRSKEEAIKNARK